MQDQKQKKQVLESRKVHNFVKKNNKPNPKQPQTICSFQQKRDRKKQFKQYAFRTSTNNGSNSSLLNVASSHNHVRTLVFLPLDLVVLARFQRYVHPNMWHPVCGPSVVECFPQIRRLSEPLQLQTMMAQML